MGGAIFRDYNFNRSINKSLRPPPAAGPDIRWIRKKKKKKWEKRNKEGKERGVRFAQRAAPFVRDFVTYFRTYRSYRS